MMRHAYLVFMMVGDDESDNVARSHSGRVNKDRDKVFIDSNSSSSQSCGRGP